MPLRRKVAVALLAPFFLAFVVALMVPIMVVITIVQGFVIIFVLIRLLVHLVIYRRLPPRGRFPLDELEQPQNDSPVAN